MNFLTRKHTDVSKDENSSFVIDSSYSLFSVLNKEQMWYFIRCFTDEPDSFWEYVHEKTGNHHLVRHVNDWNYKRPKFKRIKGLDVDVYLAAWDALDLAINAWPTIDEGISYLDFGEDTIFNEKDCIVKYRKL